MPQGEHDFAGIHSLDFNCMSNAMTAGRIRGWGQSSTIGELSGPHGQPPFHASVSSGSEVFCSSTPVALSALFAQQLFAFAAQHPDLPATGRFTQQQRPAARDSGEHRQSASKDGLAPAFGAKSPYGRPRFVTTYSVRIVSRQQRTRHWLSHAHFITLRIAHSERCRSVGEWWRNMVGVLGCGFCGLRRC